MDWGDERHGDDGGVMQFFVSFIPGEAPYLDLRPASDGTALLGLVGCSKRSRNNVFASVQRIQSEGLCAVCPGGCGISDAFGCRSPGKGVQNLLHCSILWSLRKCYVKNQMQNHQDIRHFATGLQFATVQLLIETAPPWVTDW